MTFTVKLNRLSCIPSVEKQHCSCSHQFSKNFYEWCSR